jgi:hypothetical protein
MIEEGIWKPKKAKKAPAFQMRERRACLGELVQIDGSEHAWFEERGPKCTLLVYIDDATGQLMELWFVKHESFFAYCEASRHYFERYGKPVAFYSDKHSIFRNNNEQFLSLGEGLTQFDGRCGTVDPDHLCQYAAGQGPHRTRQPDPAGPPGQRAALTRHLGHGERQCVFS